MKLAHNYIPSLRYGAKVLPSEIANYGLLTFGNVYWVDYDNGADTNNGQTAKTAYKTIAKAYAQVKDNNNDFILLSGYSSHVLTSMLTISKNRLTIVGTGAGSRKYGQQSKITMGVTTATTDVHMVKNLGTRNTFVNIKFANNNTLTQNTSCVGEGGEYVNYVNCEFYDSTKLTSDTHAEVLLNGDSPQFVNCTFGSLADSITGSKIRPAVITTSGGVASASSGGVSRDVLFDNCSFWKYAGGTATAMIKIAADNDLERYMEVRDCSFVANKLGSLPAVAIDSATLTKSQVHLVGSTASVNCTKLGTATGILSSLPTRVATTTIGIQAT
jgi:hypothetical protein